MKSSTLNIISISVAGASLIGTLFAGYKLSKVYSVVSDQIADNIDIDVPESVIREAIETAVQREVAKISRRVESEASEKIRNAVNDVTSRAKREVTGSVNAAVITATKNLDDSVTAEVKKQINNIDIRELKKEIKKEAKDKILDKFDNELDSLLGDFNQNLENVSKIYSSIAGSVAKTNSSDMVFKISN